MPGTQHARAIRPGGSTRAHRRQSTRGRECPLRSVSSTRRSAAHDRVEGEVAHSPIFKPLSHRVVLLVLLLLLKCTLLVEALADASASAGWSPSWLSGHLLQLARRHMCPASAAGPFAASGTERGVRRNGQSRSNRSWAQDALSVLLCLSSLLRGTRTFQ